MDNVVPLFKDHEPDSPKGRGAPSVVSISSGKAPCPVPVVRTTLTDLQKFSNARSRFDIIAEAVGGMVCDMDRELREMASLTGQSITVSRGKLFEAVEALRVAKAMAPTSEKPNGAA